MAAATRQPAPVSHLNAYDIPTAADGAITLEFLARHQQRLREAMRSFCGDY